VIKSKGALAISLGLSYLAAAIGSFGSFNGIEGWYQDANKPWFTPPNWAFGPAWAIWYTTMAIAAWWVWKSTSKYRIKALWAYAIQLTLNVIWSPVFFGAKLLLPGFMIAVALAISVFITMCLFHLSVKKAGYLFAPYFGWCVFASLLSYQLLILN
jgi:tryptophan-rich sensory protein